MPCLAATDWMPEADAVKQPKAAQPPEEKVEQLSLL